MTVRPDRRPVSLIPVDDEHVGVVVVLTGLVGVGVAVLFAVAVRLIS